MPERNSTNEMIVPAGDGPPARQPTEAKRPKAARRELTPEEQAALCKAEQEAKVIEQFAFPAAMAGALQLERLAGPEGIKVYLDNLIENANGPNDPIERMLIEQITLAHHRVAQLHAAAAEAKSAELVKALNAAAVRLTGEFRRLALALRTYRQPISTKHFTVVKQQNVAAGDQQVAYVERNGDQSKVSSMERDSKLVNNKPQEALDYVPHTESIPKPETSRGRQTEPAEARSTNPDFSLK